LFSPQIVASRVLSYKHQVIVVDEAEILDGPTFNGPLSMSLMLSNQLIVPSPLGLHCVKMLMKVLSSKERFG
jgi:hypothetical protein